MRESLLHVCSLILVPVIHDHVRYLNRECSISKPTQEILIICVRGHAAILYEVPALLDFVLSAIAEPENQLLAYFIPHSHRVLREFVPVVFFPGIKSC